MIKTKDISAQKKNFEIKLFLSYIAFTMILIVSIAVIHIYFTSDLNYKKFEREIMMQASDKIDKFYMHLNAKKQTLASAADNEFFLKYLDDESDYADLFFITIMQADKDIEALRYVGAKQTLEYVRDDKANLIKNINFKPVENQILQKEQVQIYGFRLNEAGKASVSFRAPLYAANTLKGTVELDICLEGIMNEMIKSMIYDIFVINDEGVYLKDNLADKNLSRVKKRVAGEFGKDFWANLTASEKYGLIKGETFAMPFFIGQEKFYLTLQGHKPAINNMENNKMIVSILIFAALMAVVFTFILTKPIRKIFTAVSKETSELGKLAKNLDDTIALKTLEIAKKDRLLQNQNKFAELGELIGNIAHQWRHPLTRLSLTVQNLRAFKKRGKLSDEIFKDAVENSLYQIEFMSNTIENFRNFYKKDDVKREFSIKSAIDGILSIIGTVIEHRHIKLEISCPEDIFIFANKNELSQILMNIIINAKDAIETKGTEGGLINIHTQKEENEIIIEIEDNAGGIPSEVAAKIFDPYFTTKSEKGTGIGLYIAKMIAKEKFNGDISVANGEKGAIFRVVLDASAK